MADPNGFAMNSGELKATARYFDQIQRASDRLGRTRYQNIIKLNNELKFTARHFDQIYRTALKLSRLKLMPRVTLDDKASGDIDRLIAKLGKVKSQVIRASADVNLRVSEKRTSSASGGAPQKVDLSSISTAINSLAVKLNAFGPTTQTLASATSSATASIALPTVSPAASASASPAEEEEPKTPLASLIEGIRGAQQVAGGAKSMLEPFLPEEKKEEGNAEEKPADRVQQTEQRVQQTQPSSDTLTQPRAGGLVDANGRPIISTPTPPPSPGPIVDETGTPVISDQQRAANEKAEKKQARKTKWQNRFKSVHGIAEKSEGFLGGFADVLEGGSAAVGGVKDAWNGWIDGWGKKKNAEEPSTSAAASAGSEAESTPAESAGADTPDGGKAKGGFFKRMLKGGLKSLPGVAGLGVDIANIFQASEGKERYQAIGSTIGNLAGEALGGLVGSVIPVGGTVIGGMAGGAGGEWLGNKIGGWFYDKFGGKEEPKPAEVTAPPAAAIQESTVTATAQATSSMAVSQAQTQAIAQTAAQAAVQATNATTPNVSSPVGAGVQLSEAQMGSISGMIQDAKAEVTNQISINISPGTVQLDIHEEIDYAEIEGKIGAAIVAKVRQAFQNYKPSGGGGGSAGPAQTMAT